MKKFFAILLAGVLTVGLAACGGSDDAATNDDSNKEEITLKIGASPTPHAEILNAAKDELAEKGIKLDIVEFTDYVQPNLNPVIWMQTISSTPLIWNSSIRNRVHIW